MISFAEQGHRMEDSARTATHEVAIRQSERDITPNSSEEMANLSPAVARLKDWDTLLNHKAPHARESLWTGAGEPFLLRNNKPIQRKWIGNGAPLLAWDSVLGELQWFYDPRNGLMH